MRARRVLDARIDTLDCEVVNADELDVVKTSAPAIPPPLPSRVTRAAQARGKPPLRPARNEVLSQRTAVQRPRKDPRPLEQAQRPAIEPATPAVPRVAAPASPWVPVNVWEFKYPWLEYRRSRLRLLSFLLLLSLGCAAYVHRAALHSYAAESIEQWPQLQAAWAGLEAVWSQCRAVWTQCQEFFSRV